MTNNLFILLEELHQQAQTTEHIPLTQFRRSHKGESQQIAVDSEETLDFSEDLIEYPKDALYNAESLREIISLKHLPHHSSV